MKVGHAVCCSPFCLSWSGVDTKTNLIMPVHCVDVCVCVCVCARVHACLASQCAWSSQLSDAVCDLLTGTSVKQETRDCSGERINLDQDCKIKFYF